MDRDNLYSAWAQERRSATSYSMQQELRDQKRWRKVKRLFSVVSLCILEAVLFFFVLALVIFVGLVLNAALL